MEWKYQRYMRDYLSTANSMDRNIGKLLDYLDKSGLAKNTVVIYASDQGFYLGEHGWFDKRFIYEESLKTPFIIRYPGVIKPGTKVQGLVSNVDWAPTVLNLAGTDVRSTWRAESFLPLLTGEKKAVRDGAYYHYYEYPSITTCTRISGCVPRATPWPGSTVPPVSGNSMISRKIRTT